VYKQNTTWPPQCVHTFNKRLAVAHQLIFGWLALCPTCREREAAGTVAQLRRVFGMPEQPRRRSVRAARPPRGLR